tara:strand:- start:65 stop:292 length:228 start_codon:yes stop_codon:yes gene_type:complete
MEEIRGKTLKEWKDYCKSDNVPIKTMKYIACLEERIEALTIPVVVSTSNCEHVRGSVVCSNNVWYKECKKCGEWY